MSDNLPEVRLAVITVSRNCFPVSLSRRRLAALAAALRAAAVEVVTAETVIQGEDDVEAALRELAALGANAVVVYLGNFGPEGPTTLLMQKFAGPVMAVAAAEESGEDLYGGRGDAYCGLLNLSYNLALRRVRAYIPAEPVGLPSELVVEIGRFRVLARVLLGVPALKVIAFGPRPHDFFACHAPLQSLSDLGVEVMENSELDLLQIFRQASSHPDIPRISADMAAELGCGNSYPALLPKLAQFEAALRTFAEKHLGASRHVVFANKCWPAFEEFFGFVPCYVNSRLAASGYPVACEVDVYGAVSEYMAYLASARPVSILDINNTVPADLIEAGRIAPYRADDLFMGFHCGNTPSVCLKQPCTLKYQLIMHSLLEPGQEPGITRGTLEGVLAPSPLTLFRLQGRASGGLHSYVAEGDILDLDPRTFGGTGVIAVREMRRFYRHVLLEQHFPHHTAVAFSHVGETLYEAVRLLTGSVPATPLPATVRYPQENPFR